MRPIDLKAIRKESGFTQAEIGKLVGVPQNQISCMESNTGRVSLARVGGVLAALGFELVAVKMSGWVKPSSVLAQQPCIYILVHESLPFFKVGKTVNLDGRLASLDPIDAKRSFCFRLGSEKAAFRVERIFHRSFHACRVKDSEAISAGIQCNGSSEWFSMDCFDRVLRFARDNADIFDGELQPLPDNPNP